MPSRLEQALNVALTVSAIAIAMVLVKRELNAPVASSNGAAPRYEEDWGVAAAAGIEVANDSGAVKIIEFLDLECPACALFHRTHLRDFSSELRQGGVSYKMVHLPLRGHRFAEMLARGAECAAGQGRFIEFVQAVLEHQDSIGVIPVERFASRSGVTNETEFARCAATELVVPRIEAGKRAAELLHVSATPTIVVNGWVLPTPPTSKELSALVRAFSRGEQPFGRDR
jgi:protein-disulfide isomerase